MIDSLLIHMEKTTYTHTHTHIYIYVQRYKQVRTSDNQINGLITPLTKFLNYLFA